MSDVYGMSTVWGTDNISKAMEDKLNEGSAWELHSIVFCGLQPIQTLQGLATPKQVIAEKFLVVFVSNREDVEFPGGDDGEEKLRIEAGGG